MGVPNKMTSKCIYVYLSQSIYHFFKILVSYLYHFHLWQLEGLSVIVLEWLLKFKVQILNEKVY